MLRAGFHKPGRIAEAARPRNDGRGESERGPPQDGHSRNFVQGRRTTGCCRRKLLFRPRTQTFRNQGGTVFRLGHLWRVVCPSRKLPHAWPQHSPCWGHFSLGEAAIRVRTVCRDPSSRVLQSHSARRLSRPLLGDYVVATAGRSGTIKSDRSCSVARSKW
jgi:hypothetical protein